MERTPESRCVMKTAASTFSPEEMSIKYVCGVDIGSQSCAGCILRSDKSVVAKAIRFANAREGWQVWEEKLGQLDATPSQILIGMEATSRYGEICITSWNNRGMCSVCCILDKPISFTINRGYVPRPTDSTRWPLPECS